MKPTIGTTLTPVKTHKTPVKKAAPVKAAATTKKAAKKVGKAVEIATKPTAAPVKKTARKSAAAKKAAPVKAATTKKAAKVPVPVVEQAVAEPAPALRRGRQPVNPEAEFASFQNSFKLGAKVEGEVTAFTSHGAIIQVELRGGRHVECYAPTTSLGNPAPARARDVLKRGDHKVFELITVDSERRIAELALA
jgi:hypothetical protein